MGKTTKMKFKEDKFVDGNIFANAGEVVEVPNESVDRWIIRGGTIVGDVELEEKKDLDQDEVKTPVTPKEKTTDEDKSKTKSKGKK